SNPTPPYTARTVRPSTVASGASTSATWFASSRVGTRTSAAGRLDCAWWMRSSNGMPKARVLPDPVLALPQRSRPRRRSGMVSAWMGKGSSIPDWWSAWTSSEETPSASKVWDNLLNFHVIQTILLGLALSPRLLLALPRADTGQALGRVDV